MSDTVLIVAAHPDDEILGAGATLARHVGAGDVVHALILAEGATARDSRRQAGARASELDALRKASACAAAAIGAQPPRFGGLPDNRLDSCALLDIVKIVEAAVAQLKPAVLYTHHGGDLNVDHRIVHAAVVTACRPLPGACCRAIYTFETPSSTEWASSEQSVAFRPTRFVDAAGTLEAKLAALACYEAEMRSFPHPRSSEAVRALAAWRGASVGLAAAEAFQIVREVVRD